MDQIQSQLA
jgi:hypothetical protein